MTAYSYKTKATEEKKANAGNVKLITIKGSHPLNNMDRPPYWNGSVAAAALLQHLQTQLSDPEKGPQTFSRMRNIYNEATVVGGRVSERLKSRQARAMNTLSQHDVEQTEEQLRLTTDIAQAQARIANKLLPEIMADGRPADAVIDAVDQITRRALRAVTADRSDQEVRLEPTNRVLNATESLVARLERINGNDHETDRQAVDALVTAVRSGNEEGIQSAVADIATRLRAENVIEGRPAGSNELDAQAIARNFTRLAEIDRNGADNMDQLDPNAWSNELLERLSAVEGIDHSDDASLVIGFSEMLQRMEEMLPRAVDRDEPITEIDEAIDPTEFAQTRDRLSSASGLSVQDNEEMDYQARSAIWTAMSMDEREFAATKIALSPLERVEAGMQMINATPPLINLPEAELGQGRFDVRMETVEEAVVMESMIQWAGKTREYPGAERSFEEIEGMKRVTMPSGKLGAMTLGIAVSANEASIERAKAQIAMFPTDMRLVLHAENANVAQELMDVRNQALEAAGIDRPFMDGSDATREFGGWTLEGNNDRILGSDGRDAQVMVAVSDVITAYNASNSFDVTSQSKARDVVTATAGALNTAQKAVEAASKAIEAAQDPKLVARRDELSAGLRDGTLQVTDRTAKEQLEKIEGEIKASVPAKLWKNLEERQTAAKLAYTTNKTAEKNQARIERQSRSQAYRSSTPGDHARAEITEGAFRRGILENVFVPASSTDQSVIKTAKGDLVEQKGMLAAQKASALLSGRPYEERQMSEAIGNGMGSTFDGRSNITATFVSGSNWFNPEKGSAKGMEALKARLDVLPKNGVLIIDSNEKNPVVKMVQDRAIKAAGDRAPKLIHATAWRVEERASAIDERGNEVSWSERETRLDLGTVLYNGKNAKGEDVKLGRPRQMDSDLRGAIVMVHGGGMMTTATYDAVMKEAAERKITGHALTAAQATRITGELMDRGVHGLTMPKVDTKKNNSAQSIAEEASIAHADQVMIGTDTGKDKNGDIKVSSDYHAARVTRMAADTGKLASIVDRDGNAIEIAAAREMSLPFAQSKADNTRNQIKDDLSASAASDYGQIILSAMPGVNTKSAAIMGGEFGTLGDIMDAAEKGTASAALPANLHPALANPGAWLGAVERGRTAQEQMDKFGMGVVSSTSPEYPASLEGTHKPIIYTVKDVDLSAPTMGLVIGGNARANEADIEAAKTAALEAKEKGWGVSIHLSGKASSDVAQAIADMPDGERPRVLLIGDGHPVTHSDPEVFKAIAAVCSKEGGGFATTTAPLPSRTATSEEMKNDTFEYIADRTSALRLHANLANAMLVVKTTGNDMELIGLRTAIEADKPIAVVAPERSSDPSLADIRFRGSEYSGNARLLQGGGAAEIMLENRHLAFQPNYIPDLVAQAESGYVRFEGSTAGKDQRQGRDEELDRNSVGTADRMTGVVQWGKAAWRAENGHVDKLIENIHAETDMVSSIRATDRDIAEMGRINDNRFLNVASRDNVREDIHEEFAAIQERGSSDVDMDIQQHYLNQRSGAGR